MKPGTKIYCETLKLLDQHHKELKAEGIYTLRHEKGMYLEVIYVKEK